MTDKRRVHRSRWSHRLKHSLRARLVALFVLLALGTTAVFMAGTRELFSTGWRELVRPLVSDYVDRLAAEIGDPPQLERAQALAQRLPISISIRGPRLQWQSKTGRGGTVYDHGDDGAYDTTPDSIHNSAHGAASDTGWRALVTRHTRDGHQIRFGLEAWRGHAERPQAIGWLTLAGLLGLTALAYLTVHRLFQPLDDIRAGAQRYEAGDFSQPIAPRRNDELGDLAGQVNAMARGLQGMLEGQRGLLLAISHELRSPLTRARLSAELLTDTPERYALLRDLGQMRDLIADLLESERLAGGSAALQRAPTDLNALVRRVVAARQETAASEAAKAAEAPPQLSLDPLLPMLALDAVRIELLLRNLIDNAVRHASGAAAPLQITTQCTPTEVTLIVRDHGPGLEDAHLARLAQPFYRPDAARSRDGGGVGLGLYLCRLVAESHGGTLGIHAAQPGLEITLRLPVSS